MVERTGVGHVGRFYIVSYLYDKNETDKRSKSGPEYPLFLLIKHIVLNTVGLYTVPEKRDGSYLTYLPLVTTFA